MSSPLRRYILDGDGEPVLEPDLLAWLRWISDQHKAAISGLPCQLHLAKTDVGEVEVSTVFLTFDHSYRFSRRPILWETMVFANSGSIDCRRYSTRQEALVGHEEMVQKMRAAQAETEEIGDAE